MNSAVEVRKISKYFYARVSVSGNSPNWLKKLIFGASLSGGVKVSKIKALDSVSFSVKKGEVFGLLGPNGSGKTTLLKILSTALLPDEGDAYVFGYSVTGEAESIRKLITTNFSLIGNPYWTARQMLEYWAVLNDEDPGEIKHRINGVLDLVGLSERADEVVSRFSMGMKVRLSLAASLLIDREVMLLDEPLLGIDPVAAKELREVIRERAREGRTIILATNMIKDVEEMCDKVCVLYKGRVITVDTPEMLKRIARKVENVHITVRGVSVKEMERILNEDEVLDISLLRRDLETGRASFKIRTQDSVYILDKLLSYMKNSGGKIISVNVSGPTLEDVIVELLREERDREYWQGV
ncbi:MAG: hypothetical protein DRJ59_07340 [Thermoprotei archaeon]|nr:MAG: hypothetical protein DRJ59_07340 [Thermoprotei archaeon]